MKPTFLILAALISSLASSFAGAVVDQEDFARNLGGWKKPETYIDYALSGAAYRTYKPEISPTPDGGIYVSIRIDHRRGWLASDDHATLELTVSSRGVISTAQSTIAVQGQSISSDVIVGSSEAGKEILDPKDTVRIGTDLVANLTAKLLRENIVEAGRVSFPAVIRHNYNHLFQSIRVEVVEVPSAVAVPNEPIVLPPPPTAPTAPATPAPTTPAVTAGTPPVAPASPTPPSTPDPSKTDSAPLEIKSY